MLWGHGKQVCLWSVSWCCQINVLSLARVRAPALGCAKRLPLLRQITATLEATELFVHWKGWPCHMRLESGEKKHQQCFNWNFKNINFVHFTHLECKWNLYSPFSHWGLSAQLIQCLPSHLVPWLQASFDKLHIFRKFLTRYFCTGPKQQRSPASKTKHF